MRLLLIGKLPPPLGGARIWFKQFVDDLRSRSNVQVIAVLTTSHPTRSIIFNLAGGIYRLLRLVWFVPKSDVVVLCVSKRGTLILGPVVWLLCRVFRKKSVLREFGGSFDLEFEELPSISKLFIGKTVLSMDLLLFQTKHLVQYFEGIAPGQVVWHANSRPLPADFDLLNSKKFTRGARKFVFLGHVKPTKGIREIVEAARLIDESIQVDVYGPLREGLTKYEFSDSVVNYRGVLSPEDVIPTLKRYDVLLFPTYYPREGYPGVILEGYSAGLPVIATNWNAISEIVASTSGILVDPKDVEGLREAMLSLIHSPEELTRLRKGAKEKAIEFSSKVWVDIFVEYASKLLEISTSQ